MKVYWLLISVIACFFSCAKDTKINQEAAERSIESYIKSHITDVDTYESISFAEFDSLKLEDTELYKKTKTERNRLDNSVSAFKQRLYYLEQSGVQKSDKLYIELKDRLDENEGKLKKINEWLKSYEKISKEYVYSLKYRYKARKHRGNAIMTYDEIFYVDKNNRVIEDFVEYY